VVELEHNKYYLPLQSSIFNTVILKPVRILVNFFVLCLVTIITCLPAVFKLYESFTGLRLIDCYNYDNLSLLYYKISLDIMSGVYLKIILSILIFFIIKLTIYIAYLSVLKKKEANSVSSFLYFFNLITLDKFRLYQVITMIIRDGFERIRKNKIKIIIYLVFGLFFRLMYIWFINKILFFNSIFYLE
jgi:hypothetical protein